MNGASGHTGWNGGGQRKSETERVPRKEGGQEWNVERLVNEREWDSLTCQSTQSGNRGATVRAAIIGPTICLPFHPRFERTPALRLPLHPVELSLYSLTFFSLYSSTLGAVLLRRRDEFLERTLSFL